MVKELKPRGGYRRVLVEKSALAQKAARLARSEAWRTEPPSDWRGLTIKW